MAASPLMKMAVIAQRQQRQQFVEDDFREVHSSYGRTGGRHEQQSASTPGFRSASEHRASYTGLNHSRATSHERLPAPMREAYGGYLPDRPAATIVAMQQPKEAAQVYSSVGYGLHIRRPLQQITNIGSKNSTSKRVPTRWAQPAEESTTILSYPRAAKQPQAPSYRHEPYDIHHDPAARGLSWGAAQAVEVPPPQLMMMNVSLDELPAPYLAPPATPSARPKILSTAPSSYCSVQPRPALPRPLHHSVGSESTDAASPVQDLTNQAVGALVTMMADRETKLLARLRVRGRSAPLKHRRRSKPLRAVSAPGGADKVVSIAPNPAQELVPAISQVPLIIFRECVSCQTEEPFIEPSALNSMEAALLHVIGENHRLDAGMAVAEKGFEDRAQDMRRLYVESSGHMREVVDLACDALTKQQTLAMQVHGPSIESVTSHVTNIGIDATVNVRAKGTMTDDAPTEVMQQHLLYLQALKAEHQLAIDTLKGTFSLKEQDLLKDWGARIKVAENDASTAKASLEATHQRQLAEIALGHLAELESERSLNHVSVERARWAAQHAHVERAKEWMEPLACEAASLTAACCYEKIGMHAEWAMGCARLVSTFQELCTMNVMDAMAADHRAELLKVVADQELLAASIERQKDLDIEGLRRRHTADLARQLEDLASKHRMEMANSLAALGKAHEASVDQLKKELKDISSASEDHARRARIALDEANHAHTIEILRLTAAHDRAIARMEERLDRGLETTKSATNSTNVRGPSLEQLAMVEKVPIDTADATADLALTRWSSSPVPRPMMPFSAASLHRDEGLLSPLSNSKPIDSRTAQTPMTGNQSSWEGLASPHMRDPFPSVRSARRVAPPSDSSAARRSTFSPGKAVGTALFTTPQSLGGGEGVESIIVMAASPSPYRQPTGRSQPPMSLTVTPHASSSSSSDWSVSSSEPPLAGDRKSLSQPYSDQLSPSPPSHQQMRSLVAFLTR